MIVLPDTSMILAPDGIVHLALRPDGDDAVVLHDDVALLDDLLPGPFIVRMRAPRSATVPCGLSFGTVMATSCRAAS